MIGQENEENIVVILSDDDDEEKPVINKNGKRAYYYGSDEQDREDEEFDEDEFGDEEYEEGEVMHSADESYDEHEDMVKFSQELPVDHESVIFSERDKKNPLQQLADKFSDLKSKVLQPDLSEDKLDTNFACGLFMSDPPSVAMNVEGVVGPIAFPMTNKDTNLIISARSEEAKDTSCFQLKTSHIILNQTFQEYVYEVVLPDIYSRLGVNDLVKSSSRMEAIQLYICGEDSKLEIPKIHPKGSYGSVLITLPSEFGGGETEARYNDVSSWFRPEIESCENSFYMAWYNDVGIFTEPIAYGHQVAIYFSLIYNGDDNLVTCASLQEERRRFEAGELSQELAAKSKSALDTITTELKAIPEMYHKHPLFYMLNYSYGFSSVKVCDLKKSDKTVVNLIKKAAEEAGYSMYIASISREVEASVNKELVNKGISKGESDEEKDCPMDEEGIYLSERIIDDALILTTLSDHNGVNQLIRPITIDLKGHSPIIQSNLWYSRCKPDSEEYGQSGSAGEASVTYFYSNNTAIALIPKDDLSLLKKPSIMIE